MIAATLCVLLFACALAEEKAEEKAFESKEDTLEVAESSYVYPAYGGSSHGSLSHGYDAYGHEDGGHDAYGLSHYGDHGQYGDNGYGAHGLHSLGGYGAHDSYGAYGSGHGKYRDVAAYVHNRGAGYEKAYAYDKKAGHADIFADHGAKHSIFGVHDKKGYHDIGSYGHLGHDSHGDYGKYGGDLYGAHGYDSGAHGHYGDAYTKSYYHTPGHGYH